MKPPAPDEGGFQETRRDMQRAIRRLNVLEYMIVVAAVLLALAGGWVVAFLLSAGTDLPLRPTWAVLSLSLIIVPAAAVFGRERLRAKRRDHPEARDGDNGMASGG
ncbi:MAG: hypothetical protein EA422_06480 [Gemmatimonadales bacterium]|nr:MAG: hypothetical protein EA422_06480 [Gemmatimonadales bacterium]